MSVQRRERARLRVAMRGAGLALALVVALAGLVLAREPAAAGSPDPCACFPKAVLPVALETMEIGGTWYLTFVTPPCPPVVEIRVGVDGAKPKSLGHDDERDPYTGKPAAHRQLVLEPGESWTPPSDADRRLSVLLVRLDGRVDGPYALRFSPREERLAAAKLELERSPRTFVSFAEHGSVYTWLSFGTLFELRHSIREVRYSIDDCSLGKRIVFSKHLDEEPVAERSGQHPDDLTFDRSFLTLPKLSTRSVCVQAVFADDTTSAVLELVRDPRHRVPSED